MDEEVDAGTNRGLAAGPGRNEVVVDDQAARAQLQELFGGEHGGDCGAQGLGGAGHARHLGGASFASEEVLVDPIALAGVKVSGPAVHQPTPAGGRGTGWGHESISLLPSRSAPPSRQRRSWASAR